MPFKAYTPFELGEIAYKAEHPIKFNPFKNNTTEWNEWNMGWLHCRSQTPRLPGEGRGGYQFIRGVTG